MGDTTPSVAGELVTLVAGKESWTLRLIKVGGPALAAVLTLVSSVIAVALPDRMPSWMAALPILAGLDASIIAAAFAGPAIKRQQEAAK